MINMVETSVNVTANEDNKNIFSLPSNVTVRDNTGYYITTVLLASSWVPTNILLCIFFQGKEINVRSSASYSNGVIATQLMFPKDMILSIN